MRFTIVVLGAVALISCGGGNESPTGPSCINIAGRYTASFNNSCGDYGTGSVTVVQTGCNFTAVFPGQGSIAGTIAGTGASFTLSYSPCSGSATGSAILTASAISGTYSGRTAGYGCCDPVQGSFTLRR